MEAGFMFRHGIKKDTGDFNQKEREDKQDQCMDESINKETECLRNSFYPEYDYDSYK